MLGGSHYTNRCPEIVCVQYYITLYDKIIMVCVAVLMCDVCLIMSVRFVCLLDRQVLLEIDNSVLITLYDVILFCCDHVSRHVVENCKNYEVLVSQYLSISSEPSIAIC